MRNFEGTIGKEIWGDFTPNFARKILDKAQNQSEESNHISRAQMNTKRSDGEFNGSFSVFLVLPRMEILFSPLACLSSQDFSVRKFPNVDEGLRTKKMMKMIRVCRQDVVVGLFSRAPSSQVGSGWSSRALPIPQPQVLWWAVLSNEEGSFQGIRKGERRSSGGGRRSCSSNSSNRTSENSQRKSGDGRG